MAGYDRQSAAQIVDAGTIHADDFNNEYNQIEAAFNASTGHAHDGTATEGAYVPLIASSDGLNKAEANGTDNSVDFSVDVSSVSTKQLSVLDGVLRPTTTNDIDLGSVTFEFKDLHLAGTATVGTLSASSASVSGNISVTGTVDGRDVATDGTKLDGIEAGAEVNENSFQTITTTSTGTGVASGGDVVADTTTDTLNLVAGDDVTITNDPVTDKITISMSSGPTNAVAGPASATDNALPRYDGTTGKLVQDSGVTVDDLNNVAGVGIDLASNTVTGTTAEFNTALSDGDFATLAGSETLTNKSIDDTTTSIVDTADATKAIKFDAAGTTATSTTIASSQTVNRTVTLPDATDTLVGKNTTDTLTNKTVSLTNNTVSGTTAEFNTALSDGDFATLAGAETLTNKTILAASNTLDNNLEDIAGLANTDGNFIVGNGANFVAESGATARTSLGLGSIATQDSTNVTITGGSITGITDLAIADGGTGASTAAGAFSNLKQDATTTTTGVVELATQTEVNTGTDTSRAVVPSTLAGSVQVSKAWVLFDGTTATPSVTASFNVSSITDNGTGDYTVNFTNNLSTTDFAVGGTANGAGGGAYAMTPSSRAVGSVRVYTYLSSTGTLTDRHVNVLVFSD